jgi:hypothetical protein
LATTGPLLDFRIDGQVSGASLVPDGKPHTVTLEAWHPHHGFSLASTDAAGKPVGISRVELIRNGVVVKNWEPGAAEARLTHTITESEPCWYAARVYGTDARWQIGVASPIYFGPAPAREARMAEVRGRIYDFTSGEERAGQVEIRRDDQVLKSFAARGPFRVRMPLDADIVVRADGFRPQKRNLLLDYGPIHRFLWYLESKDLAKPETGTDRVGGAGVPSGAPPFRLVPGGGARRAHAAGQHPRARRSGAPHRRCHRRRRGADGCRADQPRGHPARCRNLPRRGGHE